jgi:hypothetical protein
MTSFSDDCLSERHLTLFGAIIRSFARHEHLMLRLTASVAGCDTSALMILIRNQDFNDKKLALLDLLRHRATAMDRYDRICNFMATASSFLRLRNDIAHSPWTKALAPNAIQPVWIFRRQPGVKPMHGDPSEAAPRYVESDDDRIDYSLKDLETAVRTLTDNERDFTAFVDEFFAGAKIG